LQSIKVTVIIPVYNTEVYIKKCLDSVIHQSLQEIEIICLNDGSTDNSLEVINEYARFDSRIRVVDKLNEGPGVARNLAISMARGEYLGFLDSDDWLDKNMCKSLYEIASQFSSDVSICEYYHYYQAADKKTQPDYIKLPFRAIPEKQTFHWTDIKSEVFQLNPGPCDKIYRTEFVRSIHARFAEGVSYDYPFVFACIFEAKKINFIRRPLHYYRRLRIGSTSADTGKRHFDIFKIMQLMEEQISQVRSDEELKERFSNYKMYNYLLHYNNIESKYKADFRKKIYNSFDKQTEKEIKFKYVGMFVKIWTFYKISKIANILLGKYAFIPIEFMGSVNSISSRVFSKRN
jgi:glycosyltransferase involved in cell wall biosynthesis